MADIGAPLGREPEHERTLAFLEKLEQGSAGLVLIGDAGIGKTTIFESALAEARVRGARLLLCRPAASETQSSFAGLGDLLEGVLEDVLPQLAEPRARALQIALGLAPPGAALESGLLGRALLEALRVLSRDAVVLVAVDDLQWLDVASAQALIFALRRLGNDPVGLLATVRASAGSQAPFELERALDGRLERVEVGPLSVGAVQRLLREQLGMRLPRRLLRRAYDLSGGNPFYALELGRNLAEREDERLPDSLRGLVADRIERLPDETRRLLVLLAAAAQPSLALVHTLQADDALDPAERADVVICEARRVRFSHPLLAAAAWDAATSRDQKAAHRRLAELVEDPEQRARHLALGAEGPGAGIAAVLEDAVAGALARGTPVAAAELAELAVEATASSDHEALHRRRLIAAQRHETLGETERQRALLEQALAEAADDRERGEALLRLALVAVEHDLPAARAMIEEALECAAGDDALLADIYMSTSWLDHGYFGHVSRAESALLHARNAGDPSRESIALAGFAAAGFAAGRGFRADLFERAVELEGQSGFIQAIDRPTTIYGWAAKWAGDIPLSRRLLEESVARARRDLDSTGNAPLFYLAWLHVITGEWQQALDVADESTDLSRDAGLETSAAISEITRAVVEAHLGRIDEARTRVASTAWVQSPDHHQISAYAAALVAVLDGNPESAAASLDRVLAEMQASEVEEPALYYWFPTYADALVQLGRLDDLEALTAWLDERAVRLDRTWALAVCAHARGAIAGARGDVEEALRRVERALELHEATGRPFDQACTLLLHGQLLRRAKQRRRARETLEAALAEFERLGAVPWAERTRTELKRVGGRARAEGLTPTEEKLAALVAAGRSNKQIAGELFVTVRTVETNLSRIYSKLGLHSRGELTAWLNAR